MGILFYNKNNPVKIILKTKLCLLLITTLIYVQKIYINQTIINLHKKLFCGAHV